MEIQKISETTPIRLLAAWMQRVDSRQKLKTLSDRSLKDIGLTRLEIQEEILKPFWKA
ncbi:MAG: DUF1127 domain-containing protein [Deltaproteobacteria bacterium]|jgi:uncharacterized protein YjiS (DUF1127 family)|nr:DUF1127 domain-containing protein [Deltaproteobacteria bacterium]MBT4263842.1 DUF1127 domain-containing protein [Deltaproteobacteria bacterium]MBT6500313.1 DUF1127 domain-containing protein [Deltaproteobacteria bacterium]MBT6613246.1 DUF1127 domain-containing protein [Deltaproteobacteria bacterium]MBT7152946.1 DUF1127 domain-containing protein [Deltaproteobacteria bacterium]